MDQKHQILKQYFGYDTFRPGQGELIDAILSGRDVLGIMPTGGGKSICYQIPALIFPGLTLIISPLISLMEDQTGTLLKRGANAACITSSLSHLELQKQYRDVAQGKIKILFLAPERLQSPDFRAMIRKVAISFVCVDEAHCISQWGEEFRPAYRLIGEFIRELPKRPVTAAFTASADRQIKNDILHYLSLRDPFCLTLGFDRPNLFFALRHPKNKYHELFHILQDHQGECGIIYCLTRKEVELVSEKLRRNGLSCGGYHGGMKPEARAKIQSDFMEGRLLVMVATNAFGMGVDKSNIRFVIHYALPASMEAYYQEAGRAGRDGFPSECILLYHKHDIITLLHLIKTPRQMENFYYMLRFASGKYCLRGSFLEYFGEHAPANCGKCSVCLSMPLNMEENFFDRQDRVQRVKKSKGSVHLQKPGELFKAFTSNQALEQGEPVLARALLDLRKRLAQKNRTTQEKIFPTHVIREMARVCPVTYPELLSIDGISILGVLRFGKPFLKLLRIYKELIHIPK